MYTHHSHIPHTHPHVHTPLTHTTHTLTADGEVEEIDKKMKQIKDTSREETVQPLLPTSEPVVDGGDTTPPKTVGNSGKGDGDSDADLANPDLSKENIPDTDEEEIGDRDPDADLDNPDLSKENIADTDREEIGDRDPDTELAKEFGIMDPDLSKENTEDADRIHDDEWNNGWRGNEFNNNKKNSFGKQSAGVKQLIRGPNLLSRQEV